jgi:hypothetical protein
MTQALVESKKEQNKYNIAEFSTADSLLLPDLFRKIYGEHYLSGEVYDPAHYIEANETGDAISIVARGPDGLPVGHVALVASAPYRGVREVGQGVVDPECRGGGILNGMIDEAIVLADRDPEVCGLYGASLTNHTFSQRSVWRAEFVDVGFEIGFVPARMMQIEAQAEGPVSTCLQYLPLGDAPMQRTFLPGAYRDLAVHLYDHLRLQRQFDQADEPLDRTAPSRIAVLDLPRFDIVRVNIMRIGADLPALLRTIDQEAQANGRTMVQVFLELGSPTADAACEALRKQGFWFGGLLPRWMDRDALLMQKAVNGEPWFDGIQAFTNDAKALLRFIRADADRQGALAALGVA